MINSASFNPIQFRGSIAYNPSVNFKGADKSTSLKEHVKKELDNKVFTFTKYDGEEFKGTIREYFENSITNKRAINNVYMYHCTDSKNTALSIIKNGLDWTKTNRMKAGPGTYFSPSSVGGMEQGAGSVPIEAHYIGDKREYPVFETNFYEAMMETPEIMD